MVKEFEMKKSADQYARATTSKTGTLDMNKLHTYKYNEDLFKKVTILPGATNHGLVMVVDWSGSMAENLKSTVEQLFNLVWFCRRIKIPFEVFAFTDGFCGGWTITDDYIYKPISGNVEHQNYSRVYLSTAIDDDQRIQEGLTVYRKDLYFA